MKKRRKTHAEFREELHAKNAEIARLEGELQRKTDELQEAVTLAKNTGTQLGETLYVKDKRIRELEVQTGQLIRILYDDRTKV